MDGQENPALPSQALSPEGNPPVGPYARPGDLEVGRPGWDRGCEHSFNLGRSAGTAMA
jgi:hypothetical protein